MERTGTSLKGLFRFVRLVFAFSWIVWGASTVFPGLQALLLVLGTFGPMIAAVTVLAGIDAGLGPILSRLLIWRVPLWVYAYAGGFTFVGALIALIVARVVTGTGSIWPDAMPLWVPVATFLYVLVFSVAGRSWGGAALLCRSC